MICKNVFFFGLYLLYQNLLNRIFELNIELVICILAQQFKVILLKRRKLKLYEIGVLECYIDVKVIIQIIVLVLMIMEKSEKYFFYLNLLD